MTHHSRRAPGQVDSPLWPLAPRVCSEWVQVPGGASSKKWEGQEAGPHPTSLTLLSRQKAFIPNLCQASQPPACLSLSQGTPPPRTPSWLGGGGGREGGSGLGCLPVCSVQPASPLKEVKARLQVSSGPQHSFCHRPWHLCFRGPPPVLKKKRRRRKQML